MAELWGDSAASRAMVSRAAAALATPLVARVGNTYKALYESTSMRSGILLVVLANALTAFIALVVFRFFFLRSATLSRAEESLILSSADSSQRREYSDRMHPFRRIPPEHFTSLSVFFYGNSSWSGWAPSYDVKMYLRFQQQCIQLVVVAGVLSMLVLIPAFFFGGESRQSSTNGHHIVRSFFEKTTSKFIPYHSALLLLVVPFFTVLSALVVRLYYIVAISTRRANSLEDWLSHPARRRSRKWPVLMRRLPGSLKTDSDLATVLDSQFPGTVVGVELIYKETEEMIATESALRAAERRFEYLLSAKTSSTAEKQGEMLALALPPAQIEHVFYEHHQHPNSEQHQRQRLDSHQQPLHATLLRSLSAPMAVLLARTGFREPTLEVRIAQVEAQISRLRRQHVALWEKRTSLHIAFVTFNDSDPPEVLISRSSAGASFFVHGMLGDSRTGMCLPEAFRHALPGVSHRRLALSLTSGPSFESIPERAEENSGFWSPQFERVRVVPAPPPGDVILRNIGMSYFHRVMAELFVEVLVFLLLSLFSSPIAMIAGMKQLIVEALKVGRNNSSHVAVPLFDARFSENSLLSPTGLGLSVPSGGEADEVSQSLLALLPGFVMQNDLLRRLLLVYTPVLLLSVLSAAVPSVLRAASNLQGYTTKSAQELSVFRKTVFYVLLNSVILPSLALDTASEIAMALLGDSAGHGSRTLAALPLFERVLTGDMWFFLCNLIVQLTGTTTMLSLLRLPDAVRRWWDTRQAVTPLERAEAKCAPPFDYAYNYASTIVVLCMCLLFGGIAPIIWLFALPFFLVKHTVDVFNLRYVHPDPHMEGAPLHRNAAALVVFWCVLSELVVASTLYLRGFLAASIAMTLLAAAVLLMWVFARSLSRSDRNSTTAAFRRRRRNAAGEVTSSARRMHRRSSRRRAAATDAEEADVAARGAFFSDRTDNTGIDGDGGSDAEDFGSATNGSLAACEDGARAGRYKCSSSARHEDGDSAPVRRGAWFPLSVLNLEVSSMSGSSSEDDEDEAPALLHYGSISSTVFAQQEREANGDADARRVMSEGAAKDMRAEPASEIDSWRAAAKSDRASARRALDFSAG